MKQKVDFFTEIETYMIGLLRYGVLDERPEQLLPSSEVDWDKMMDIAATQGILAWVWDGICKLPKENQPSRLMSINWGLSAQEIWDRYNLHVHVLNQMLEICTQNSIRLLLFKGIALSKLFPKPESRPAGDIDIYLFENYKKGDELFAHYNVTKTNKRTGFDYQGVHIENHRIFLNTYTKLQVDAIKYLESTLKDVIHTEYGYYIMSPIASIVYQVMHFVAHFDDASASLSLKFVVDFGVTMQAYSDKVNAVELRQVLERLNIVGVFCLLLGMVENVTGLRYDCYRFYIVPQDDVKAVFHLIMHRPKDFVPLLDRTAGERFSFYRNRYQQFDNLFKYLPISRRSFVNKSIREFFSISIRRLFHLPDGKSLLTTIKENIIKK